MNVKKFTAPTSREALRKVRDALGPDAIILSNRAGNGLVEVLALAGEDVAALAEPEMIAAADSEGSFDAPRTKAPKPLEFEPIREQIREPIREQIREPIREPMAASFVAPAISAIPAMPAEHHTERQVNELRNEIRAMRGMMESQLAEIAYSAGAKREPHKAHVMRAMLGAGFSAGLARYLTEKAPPASSEAQAVHWLKGVLERNLSVLSNEDEILEKGGVFALVGPTGVGKTTNTAKLAARCVMRHGTDKLALITTDGYRIGGHEQLRIYGKILGVMVHSVKDETDLRIALRELRGKHTVLIDTIGVSQRDQMVAEQVAMLSGAGANVQRLLCLNATSTGETLSEVVRAYQGSGLTGCIMTKLDEAATIGNVLDVIIRAKLTLYYVSNGQRVPEDLHLADRAYLLERAFKAKTECVPYQLQDDELPLMMAHAVHAARDKSIREVNLG